MKNNYPIKYAVMPIKEHLGWRDDLNELEENYGVIYIASKCYVVGRQEEYSMYGDILCQYNVVFPYEKDKRYGDFLSRVEPRECLMNGRCNNFINVDKVFDNFNEAKEEASKKNKKILSKILSFIPFGADFNQNSFFVKGNHEELVNYYQKIENMIEENSTDLVVNDKVKEQSVIFGHDNSYKKKEYSLYDMIRLFSDENFIAYNISLEDYKKIEEQLKNGEQVDTDSIKKNCLLISSSGDKKVKVVNYDSTDKSCFYIEKGSLYYDGNMDFSIESIRDDTIVFYTIETYADVINSYIVNYVMNWDMPKNKYTEKVFRKRIELR